MLLDTSGILCLVVRSEVRHAEAKGHYDTARRRVTHSYVLAEWVALAQVRGVPRAVALAVHNDLCGDDHVQMEWVGEQLHCRAVELLEARPDKSYSLCDAVSFVLMRAERIQDALTTDRHFEQEGFRRLLN